MRAKTLNKKPQTIAGKWFMIFLVMPMGERSNFDPEDLLKIFEFLEIIEVKEEADVLKEKNVN